MYLVFFIISFGASIIGAISGIGGGVIIKPVMDVVSGLGVSTISFLSSTTVLSMATVSLIRSRKSPVSINVKNTSMMAVGGILGGLAGKNLFDLVKSGFGNDKVIGISQSVFLFIITLGVLLFYIFKQQIKPQHHKSMLFSIFVGLVLGGFASFLGIGGGPINLAVLYFFFSMDSKTAALNSIFIIFFSQVANLLFTILSGNLPEFEPASLIIMIIGGITGGLTGSFISHRMTNRAVDKLFMGVLAIIMILCIYNTVRWFT